MFEKSRPCVLVLDDEELVREMLRRWLTHLGFHVMAAATPEEAMQEMEKCPAAVVLADIVMPGEHDGIWFAERIRERWPDVPIIFESGVQALPTIHRAHKLGAVDFLPKPFGRESLYQALMKAVTNAA